MLNQQNKNGSRSGESKEVLSSLDDLFRRSKRIKSSKEFIDLLKFVRTFRNYSPYNNLLIYLQNPQATYYATAKHWFYKFKRTVKEDARPMLILAPMTPVLLVYDIDDTEGKYKPELLEKQFEVTGELNPDIFGKMINSCNKMDIVIQETDFSDSKAGDLTIFGQGNFPRIRLNKSHNNTQKYATLIHELAHLFLGHLNEKDKEWKDRSYLSTNLKELEAESVSYILCQRHNINSRSDIYLFFYTYSESDFERISIDLIMKIAGKIEKMGK